MDLTWQASWPASSTMVARLIGEIVYQVEHDSTIKAAQRNQKPPDELVLTGSIGERIEQIEETIKAGNAKLQGQTIFVGCAYRLLACHAYMFLAFWSHTFKRRVSIHSHF